MAIGRTELEIELDRASLEVVLAEELIVGGGRSRDGRGSAGGSAAALEVALAEEDARAASSGGARERQAAGGSKRYRLTRRRVVADARSRAGKSEASVDSGTASSAGLVHERDLKTIEREHPEGLTSVQVVDIFSRRGIRFSEATFRKYVQQGLLPRSRRVGRKGKHQGSLGLYPATTVRRINVIKRLQSEGHTIEDILRRFLRYRDEIEVLERGLNTLFGSFEEELRTPHFDTGARQLVKKDLGEARQHALELLRLLEAIEKRVAGQPERTPGGAAPGGAEDLL